MDVWHCDALGIYSGYEGAAIAPRHVEPVDDKTFLRGHSFRATCRALHVRHHRTRPYTPRMNGKAERFIQTALREWAYRRPYYTSAERAQQLPGWLEHYNCARPHASLAAQPPMSRFPGGNNLMLAHS